MTPKELFAAGYVKTSHPDLRVELWEKHEGPTGSRSLADQITRDSVTGEVYESDRGVENIEHEDLQRFSDNLDHLELMESSSLSPAVKTRMKAARKTGGAKTTKKKITSKKTGPRLSKKKASEKTGS